MVWCVFGKEVIESCPVLESFKKHAQVKIIEFGMLSGFCQVCPHLKTFDPPLDVKIWRPSNEEKPEEQ